MEINLKNIEEIIFFDKKVQAILPEFKSLFDQWVLSHRVSGLKQMAQHSVIELINSLSHEHIKKLSEYFNEDVYVNKLNKKLVDHYDCNIDDTGRLCEFSEYVGTTLFRKGNELKFTFWR